MLNRGDIMPTLGEKDREWIMEQNKLWMKNRHRHLNRREISHWARIREKALEEIDDLTFLANHLPEKQLKIIFNKSTLFQKRETPMLMPSLFRFEKLEWESEAELEKKRKRLLTLAKSIVWRFFGLNFARKLAPKTAAYLSEMGEKEVIAGLKVIYHGRE